MSQPFRTPKAVDDFLANGTTPEEQVIAEAESCTGDPESYERALARQAERTRSPRVMRTPDGRPFMAVLAAALGVDGEG